MTRGGGKRAAIGAVLIAIALGFGGALANLQPDAARATAPTNAQPGAGSGDAQNRADTPPTQPNPSSAAAAQSTTDYDDDDDGLIDVTTLAQLNAIRWDLNGDGDVSSTDAANYLLAFPSRDTAAATRMGCPSGTCTGYELRADLNFDTDGDGDVDSSDSPSYADWVPIGGTYSGTFKGNNRTISNLRITGATGEQYLGLFAQASGEITGVGLVNAVITSTRQTSTLAVASGGRVGALVGRTTSVVRSSYATGSVTHTTGTNTYMWIGGLVGECATTGSCAIAASWADVDVTTSGSAARAGGLVGWLGTSATACYAAGSVNATGSAAYGSAFAGDSATTATITASYAIGAMSGRLLLVNNDGITGTVTGRSNVPANSYWDTQTTGKAHNTNTNAEGKTTSQLQTPTGYTGIYSTWNLNIDGQTGNDDPWDFGSSSQYPVLKFGGQSAVVQRGDYDSDDDNLIDIKTLAQLNAVRYDLNGDGAPNSSLSAANLARFKTAWPRLPSNISCHSTCAGYELLEDLDFDTDGDGDVDANDSPSFTNWAPIGGTYSAEFKGNNKTIANLRITGANQHYVGLFRQASGVITGVGLPKVVITSTRQVGSLQNTSTGGRVGALVGRTTNAVRTSYATGSVTHTMGATTYMFVGGLVGECVASSSCTIAASWADVDVTSSATVSYVGGLVGWLGTSITASYAKGAVHASHSTGGYGSALAGNTSTSATITASYATGAINGRSRTASNSDGVIGFTTNKRNVPTNTYWDTGTTDKAHNANTNAEGKTASQLQSVTSYTGIYANWNVNVNGVAGVDDPWDFGTGMQYPMLKFDGMSLAAQGGLVMGIPGTNNNNPVVGQTAQVCLVDGPTGRAPRSGSPTLPARWEWQKSSDGISWTDITEDGGATYEYTPVTTSPTDVGNYLRACVDVRANLNVDRVLGEDRVCVGPFAKVRASN